MNPGWQFVNGKFTFVTLKLLKLHEVITIVAHENIMNLSKISLPCYALMSCVDF